LVDQKLQIGYNVCIVNKKELKMKIKIGDKVTWSSAAGQLVGSVANIVLDLNAANQTIPWMDIRNITDQFNRSHGGVRMCASDSYLKQMKVALV
jgi:hypothetical protein